MMPSFLNWFVRTGEVFTLSTSRSAKNWQEELGEEPLSFLLTSPENYADNATRKKLIRNKSGNMTKSTGNS